MPGRVEHLPERTPRRALVVAAVAVAVALGVSALTSGRDSAVEEPVTAAPADELQTTLQTLRRTWVPARVDWALAEMAGGGAGLGPGLAELLSSPDHRYFREGMRLAVALKRVDLRPLLLAGMKKASPDLRAEIVHAVDELSPWATEELSELLVDESMLVLLAALEIASTRTERPNVAIYELLLHPDRAVRVAALAALPDKLSPADAREIWEHARYALGASGEQVILALGRAPAVVESDRLLRELVAGQDEALCSAALRALGSRALAPAHAAAVYGVLADAERSVEPRAMALSCLERTRTFDRLETVMDVWPSHPVLEYFAARVLISAGRREGVQKLFDVLATPPEEFRDVTTTVAVETQLDARRLLSKLSKTGLYSGEPKWRAWYDGLDRLEPAALHPPSVRFRTGVAVATETR